ncbi:Xylose isomerase-like TIM barrel [Rubripirellula tenax]|uniref:Xylose isomerase-like TIM barrel n=1 Tax=Rubripirellula tenax TaxID=2528015 RepID=A0A5C6FJ12_9BACT|nr:sugar phosphate isomerase/epimerase family protein [Rubripirellula tenax]TWU60795.1 Xylose isomerase-like TIM barrel [Rubripirellula tenax]
MYRRQFLQTSAAIAFASAMSTQRSHADEAASSELPFKISLAEWSLHRTLRDPASKITNLDFARIAKQEFGIDGIEYVNQFFKDKGKDETYLADMKDRAESEGVKSLLIMVDGEGNLGDPDETKRSKAVENHHQWVEAAKFLGCHSIRVNAASNGTYLDQIKYASDGLRALSEFAQPHGINVIVENHGGLSSNAAWLAVVIERVGLENCGTLPDFGNFYITRGKNEEMFDRYHGVQAMMPYAKAVSAKTHDFDESGEETHTDYEKMMRIVLAAGYHGYVGIEYEGSGVSEFEGIKKSRDLLIKVGKKLA